MPSEVYKNKSKAAKSDPSICSCDVCDSIECFVKRNQNVHRCTCGKCSETCLLYLPEKVKFTELNKITDTNFIPTSYEKEVVKTKTVVDKNFEVITSKISKQSHKFLPCHKKSSSFPCGKNIINRKMCFDNQPITNQNRPENTPTCVQNVIVNKIGENLSSSTAKLSAQVMNVPYSEFENSMSFQKRPLDSERKLTKLDVLDRIKKAYEACSCKPCECVSSTPVSRYEKCDCKPCECNDCRKLNQYLFSNDGNQSVCLKRNVSNNEEETNRVQCGVCKKISTHRHIIVAPVEESTQRRECTCSPCDCMECDHPYGTINTSPTHEMSTGISRHRNCQCEACLNEACDTEAAETCRCEGRDRLMRKPVQKDTNDYDIRSALICNTKSQIKSSINECSEKSLINNYNNFTNIFNNNIIENKNNSRNDSVKSKVHKKTSFPVTSRNLTDLKKILKCSDLLKAICTCEPCECEVCSIKKTNKMCATNSKAYCVCKVCDCWSCKAKLKGGFEYHKINSEALCACEQCECMYCNKMMLRSTGDVCDCENCKRERNLERFMQEKIKKPNNSCIFVNQAISDYAEVTENVENVIEKSSKLCTLNKSAETYVAKKSGHENMYYQTYRLHNRISCLDSSFQREMQQKLKKYILTNRDTNLAELKNGFKCNTFIQCKNGRTIRYVNKFSDLHKKDSFASALSSNTSKGSFINESNSTVPNTKNNAKNSIQSSCNSSGHDHSDYLILFPRTTAGTCIKDVMNLDLNSNVNIQNMNIPKKTSHKINPLFKKSAHISLNNINKPFHKDSIKMLCSKVSTSLGKPLLRPSCKHNHPEKLCDCNSCDCENCSFSRIKQSCCNCDCLACNCYGVCLTENQSICIKKNESVQTYSKKYQDKGEDCIDWRTLMSINESYENNFYRISTQLFPILPNSNEYMIAHNKQLIDYSLSNDRHDRADTYFPWSYYNIKHAYLATTLDVNFYKKDNYLSLRNTLKEARAFSTGLLQILNKYEKANREFESIAQKIKQNEIFVKTTTATTTSNSKYKMPAIDAHTNYDLTSTKEGNVIIKNEYQDDKHNTESSNCLNSKTNIKICQIEDILIENKNVPNLDDNSSLILKEVCKNLLIDKKDQILRNRYAKYQQLIKKSELIANMFKFGNSILRNTSGMSRNKKRNSEDSEKYTDIEYNSKSMEVLIPNREHDFDKEKQLKLETDNMMHIHKDKDEVTLSKTIKDITHNSVLATTNTHADDASNHKIQDTSLLQQVLDLKSDPKFGSKEFLQPENLKRVRSNTLVNKVENFISIQLTVEELPRRETIWLQDQITPIIKNMVSRTEQCKPSKETLKVTFKGIERVSDHTFVVRWEPPLETKHIQGYELLVDGRAVQKILVPTRSMARVTVIPHSDRMILTIRTIIASYNNNYPSSTIIYRPRLRHTFSLL